MSTWIAREALVRDQLMGPLPWTHRKKLLRKTLTLTLRTLTFCCSVGKLSTASNWVAEIAVDARIGIREAYIRKLLISATIKVARQEPQWQGHTVSHLY